MQGGDVRYAGFWIRLTADILDNLVMVVPWIVATCIHPYVGGVILVISWIAYKSLLLTYWHGQTVGKRVCGIKVVDRSRQPVRLGQAFARTFAEILSVLVLCIGYLMIAFDDRKQALHDRLTGTLHIYVD